MFRYTNPHPQGLRVGDCVKRACVLASGIDYHDIAIMLNRYRKISGAKKFNSDYNWRDFIENVLLGQDMGNLQYANHGHRYKVSEYAKHNQGYGRAIVQCSKHLVAINGLGDYLDTWDSGEKSIYKAWRLPTYTEIVNHIRKAYPKLCKGLSLDRYKILLG